MISAVSAPCSRAQRQRPGHERRPAGGRQTDCHVPGTDGPGLLAPQVCVVLDVLDRADQRLDAAGVVRDEQARRRIEGRSQLCGVEDGETPGRAGPEVVDAATAADAGDRSLDEQGELREHLGDRDGHGRVLRVEQPEHLERREAVDVGRVRVALLGRRAHPHVLPAHVIHRHVVTHLLRLVSPQAPVNVVKNWQAGRRLVSRRGGDPTQRRVCRPRLCGPEADLVAPQRCRGSR